tara:strand:- start:17924 stop:18166 length:243 start_codon:yes stop_codon:yes gene_type:complete
MTLSFPDNPAYGQEHNTAGRTYRWSGESWEILGDANVHIDSDVTEVTNSERIVNMIAISNTDYLALTSYDDRTVYLVYNE